MLTGLVATSLIVFAGWLTMALGFPSLAYTIFPFLIWAALRFGQQGTTAVTLIASSLAIWASLRGLGPFGTGPIHERLLLLQVFMGVVAVTALLLGASLTERRRAEAQVRENEGRLRLALEAGRLGTWEWNLETDEVIGSPGLEAIHGLAQGAFQGGFVAYLGGIHPEDRELVNRSITQAVKQGGEYRIEYRIVWPDKSVRWLEGKGKVFHDEAGRPVRMSAVCVDITARKRDEQRFAVLHAVTRILAESATLTQATPRIVQAVCDSLAWQLGAIWQVDAEEQLLRCVEVWHAGSARFPEFEAITRQRTFERGVGLPGRVWAGGQPAWIPDVVHDSNFPRAPVAAREGLHGAFGFPIRLGGAVLGVIEFFSSEIRQPDDDLLQMMATVGSQIGQFIERKRGEGELQRRAAKLAEADRRKDEFLALLAHELRNPLAPICNGVALLKTVNVSDPRLQQIRDMMERQVQQMTRMVDDLLDVSRITRGKITLRKGPTDLAAVIARAVETSGPLIDSRRHELTVSVSSEPLALEGDPTRLAQVFANLLNNAAQYTREGGRIWLTAGREGVEAVVRVRDTGVGIAPEMLPHVFDVFTQADRSLERAGGGLGIGLTLVHRLVEMHGGSVEAASEGIGKGSEFTVRLPLQPRHRVSRPAEPPGDEHSVVGARRVLVVDDNRDSADSLGLLLELQGHKVCIVHDGPGALAAAQTHRPHAVLLDIGLPGMDGYEVARQLRQLPGLDRVLLIAMTGYGQEEDKRRSQQAGFDAHLVKPADLDAVQALLAHPESENDNRRR